jgi:hypothetical protein
MQTVHGFGEDASRAGLAGSAWAREKVGVRDATLLDCVAERPNDMLLTIQVVERAGTPFPVQRSQE